MTMRPTAAVLSLLVAFAPANACGDPIIEEKTSDRKVLGYCASNRIEGDTYRARILSDGQHIGFRAYYYLNDEKIPLVTYDAARKEFSFDFNRDNVIDNKKPKDQLPEEFSQKLLCEIIEKLKR